jgi:hypothetical protein
MHQCTQLTPPLPSNTLTTSTQERQQRPLDPEGGRRPEPPRPWTNQAERVVGGTGRRRRHRFRVVPCSCCAGCESTLPANAKTNWNTCRGGATNRSHRQRSGRVLTAGLTRVRASDDLRWCLLYVRAGPCSAAALAPHGKFRLCCADRAEAVIRDPGPRPRSRRPSAGRLARPPLRRGPVLSPPQAGASRRRPSSWCGKASCSVRRLRCSAAAAGLPTSTTADTVYFSKTNSHGNST